MTDASESIDLDELERFTDQWAENPHNGDTIYSLAWMVGPEDDRTEASATLTVSGLRKLVARVRKAEARIEKAEDYVTRHYLDTTVGERILAALTEGDEQ